MGLSAIFNFLTSSLRVTTFCLLAPRGENFFKSCATCLGSFTATAFGGSGASGVGDVSTTDVGIELLVVVGFVF